MSTSAIRFSKFFLPTAACDIASSFCFSLLPFLSPPLHPLLSKYVSVDTVTLHRGCLCFGLCICQFNFRVVAQSDHFKVAGP